MSQDIWIGTISYELKLDKRPNKSGRIPFHRPYIYRYVVEAKSGIIARKEIEKIMEKRYFSKDEYELIGLRPLLKGER